MNETIESLKVQGQWNIHRFAINAIQFSPDKKYLASGDDEGLLVVRETATYKCLRLYKANKSITCLKWDPTKPSVLYVGSSNGEVNKIRISPSGAHYDDQSLEILAGWIHVICVNDKGTQVFVAQGNRLTTAFRSDSLEKTWGLMFHIPIPTVEDGTHPLIRQLHWIKDMIIVCFFFEGLGVIAYTSSAPFKKVWTLKIRPCTVIGGSALSPSGKRLVIFNMLDGLDWYDTLKQCRLSTSRFEIGACRFSDVALIDEDTAIVGHPLGSILMITYDGNVVREITCLETPDPLQALDFAVINKKLMIAGGSMPVIDSSAKMVLLVEDPRDVDNRKRRSNIRKCGYCLIQMVVIFTTLAVVVVLSVPPAPPNPVLPPIHSVDTIPPAPEMQTTTYWKSSSQASTTPRNIVESKRQAVIRTKTAARETATTAHRTIETGHETTVTVTEAVILTVTEIQAILVTHTEATAVTETTVVMQTPLVTAYSAYSQDQSSIILHLLYGGILLLCAVLVHTGRDSKDPSAEPHSCPAQTELDRIRASMAQMQEDDLLREGRDPEEHPMNHPAVTSASDGDEVRGTPEESKDDESRHDNGEHTGTGRRGVETELPR